jgi:tetratricopeptide (TPR) repeat protein
MRGTVGRVAVALVVAATMFVTGAVFLGATDRPPLAANAPLARDGATIPTVPGGSSTAAPGDIEAAIASLQDRVEEVPADWRAWASLGLAYVQQARVTADPTYYPKAEGVLRRSLAEGPRDNPTALIGLASLAAARHDFARALELGRRAERIAPFDANVYGVIGDAQVELGRYPAAFASFQRMVDTLPSLSSYARVAYARELQGDVPGAIVAMGAASRVAGSPADRAWTATQLGDLEWSRGAVAAAARHYRRAVGEDPTFVPGQAGLARVAWARGDLATAIARYREVTTRYPSAEYVIALGDLLTAAGRADAAARQYELVGVIQRLAAANGVDVDLELALFEADHGDPAAAVRMARATWRTRTSVFAADALGWALYRDDRAHEALRFARHAVSLGTRDARLLFHAGAIELAAGRRAAGERLLREALRINPHFSILGSREARDLLALGGAR